MVRRVHGDVTNIESLPFGVKQSVCIGLKEILFLLCMKVMIQLRTQISQGKKQGHLSLCGLDINSDPVSHLSGYLIHC